MAGARELAHMFYTDKILQDASSIHLVDYYLKMAVAAGAKHKEVEFKLPENAKDEEAVKKVLMEHRVNLNNYVVIVPGAARNEKCWGVWEFSQIVDSIAEKFGSSFVATGSKGEYKLVEILQELAHKNVVNLAGQTTITELIALMKKASLVVSNDTGPGHIAAAMGVPIVMIFGPTNPARVCPYKRPECVVAVEPSERGMKADSYEPRHDIIHITVEQVFEKACRQIGEKDSPSTPLRAG
jgi:ADP-heptose:LPS heptosyltransferase